MARDQTKIMMTMALSAEDPETERYIFSAFRAMEDERKETCIHCRSVWYAIHFRDGVCHGCQGKKMPGRSVLEARARATQRLRFWLIKMPLWALAATLLWRFVS